MASDTSSRSTAAPSSRLIAASNAVECVVNGGTLLPNECTINTRRGRSPSAPRAAVAPARNSGQSKMAKVRAGRHVRPSDGPYGRGSSVGSPRCLLSDH